MGATLDSNGTGSYEIIIVGAGPAGQTAALYAGRSRIPTLVLEKGIPGGQLWNTAEVEDYPGFEHIMGPDLADKIQQHAQKFGATFETDEVDLDLGRRRRPRGPDGGRQGVSALRP